MPPFVNERPESKQRTDKMNAILTTTIRPNATVRSLLSYGEDGSVMIRKDSKVTPDELVSVIIEDAGAASSATVRAVNTMRLARLLPDVKREEVKGKDAKQNEIVLVSAFAGTAFDYVKSEVKAKCATQSTFDNILHLVECADLAANSGLKASPFAVKEALGYLRKVKAISAPSGNKGAKLLLNKAGIVGAKLKEGIGVNAIRPVIKKAKEAKPALFKATAPVLKQTDAPDKVALDLKTIKVRWDKLAGENKVADLRVSCSEVIRELAKLAGFDTTPIVAKK